MKILALIASMLFATSAFGQSVLPMVDSPTWHTESLFVVAGDASLSWQFNNCGVGPAGIGVSLPASGVIRLLNPAASLCGGQYGTIPSPSADSFVHITFSGPNAQSYYIPALGSVDLTKHSRLGPISTTDGNEVAVVVFPTSLVRLRVIVLDGVGQIAGTEIFDVTPPVAQFKLATVVHEGSLDVSLVDDGVGYPGKVAPTPAACFATMSDSKGGNALVFPCK